MVLRPLLVLALTVSLAAGSENKAAIAIAKVQRSAPVTFDREVLPILSDNCLACHCQTTKKGGLDLETPAHILEGGENGPAIDVKTPSESLLLQAAAHRDEDLVMPPPDNKAKAKDLTPEQLGLIRLWIEQGAKESPHVAHAIPWQPLAGNLSAIYAVAVTGDGQFAACARENHIFLYRLPGRRCIADEVAHRDQVNSLAFSPDGELLASGGFREVKLWRRSPVQETLALPNAGALAKVSPDGKWLATATEDGNVRLFPMPLGKEVRTLAVGKDQVTAMAFSPDGARLAVASGKSISLWNLAEGQARARIERPHAISALTWLASGNQLASAGGDNVIHIWKDSLEPAKELQGHAGPVTSLEPVGADRLLSGSEDGSIRLWDVEKSQSLLEMKHGAPILALAVRPDGQRFASAAANNSAKLWGADGKLIAELRGSRLLREAAEERGRAAQIANGTVAYRKDAMQNLEKLLTSTQERIKKSTEGLPAKQQDLEQKEKARLEALYAKDGLLETLVAADAAAIGAAGALDAAEKAAEQAKSALASLQAAAPPDSVAIDKAKADLDSKNQALGKARTERDQKEAERKQAADKVTPAKQKLADAETALKKSETAKSVAETELALAKEEEQKTNASLAEAKTAVDAVTAKATAAAAEVEAARKTAEAGEQPIRALAFSKDNLLLATAGDDHLVHTWDADGGAACDVVADGSAAIVSLGFTENGDLLSASREGRVSVRNIRREWKLERVIGTGEADSPIPDRVDALAFSHDGHLLATGGGEPSRGGSLDLWNPATGELLRKLPKVHSDAIFGLAFSPDDQFLLSGAADRMARVVEVATGKIVRTLEGHTHHVLAVSWSQDGRTLATAGADNQVKLWDALTGDRKKSIEGCDKEVTSVAFAGAGGDLITGSGDSKVRLVSPDGKVVRVFPEVTDYVQAAAVTADGKVIVAGGDGSVLRVWNNEGAKIAAFPPEGR
ncbi:MAG TPA: c-type cytochrome domain-containing protein [Chthoniobacteraceae bacterium]